MAQSKELKILSLDGGGIRGLSSLEILRRVMYRAGQEMQPPVPDLQPWQYFDLIGGTSTGGIIALMLGRLRMSTDECIKEYVELSETIFKDRRKPPHEEMFDAKRLEKAIKKVVKRRLGEDHEDAPLLDPLGKDDCCKTLVYTLPYDHADAVQPIALRTYESKHEEPLHCTIWQAARATSAAPTFFAPINIGSPPKSFIDAGLKFNNPSKALKREAGRIWGNAYGDLDYIRNVALFLSIGTGFADIARFDENLSIPEKISKKFQVPLRAVGVMLSIVSDTETTAQDLEFEFASSPGVYHRLNVEQGLQLVELFEYEKLQRVVADTEEYLNQRSRLVTACVVQMATLPMASGPLTKQLPIESPKTGKDEDEALRRRLNNLQISLQEYQRTEKGIEGSSTYKESLTRFLQVDYLWQPLVLADILDKRGSLLLLACTSLSPSTSTSPSNPPPSSESTQTSERSPTALVTHVMQQTTAFESLRLAFTFYRHLYHRAEIIGTWSLEYCWVANRIGDILRAFGLRREALRLLREAAMGRVARLGAEHKSSVESVERVAFLESQLDADGCAGN